MRTGCFLDQLLVSPAIKPTNITDFATIDDKSLNFGRSQRRHHHRRARLLRDVSSSSPNIFSRVGSTSCDSLKLYRLNLSQLEKIRKILVCGAPKFY